MLWQILPHRRQRAAILVITLLKILIFGSIAIIKSIHKDLIDHPAIQPIRRLENSFFIRRQPDILLRLIFPKKAMRIVIIGLAFMPQTKAEIPEILTPDHGTPDPHIFLYSQRIEPCLLLFKTEKNIIGKTLEPRKSDLKQILTFTMTGKEIRHILALEQLLNLPFTPQARGLRHQNARIFPTERIALKQRIHHIPLPHSIYYEFIEVAARLQLQIDVIDPAIFLQRENLPMREIPREPNFMIAGGRRLIAESNQHFSSPFSPLASLPRCAGYASSKIHPSHFPASS